MLAVYESPVEGNVRAEKRQLQPGFFGFLMCNPIWWKRGRHGLLVIVSYKAHVGLGEVVRNLLFAHKPLWKPGIFIQNCLDMRNYFLQSPKAAVEERSFE